MGIAPVEVWRPNSQKPETNMDVDSTEIQNMIRKIFYL